MAAHDYGKRAKAGKPIEITAGNARHFLEYLGDVLDHPKETLLTTRERDEIQRVTLLLVMMKLGTAKRRTVDAHDAAISGFRVLGR